MRFLSQPDTARKNKNMVRKGGFEPPRLSAPPPQDGVSASSTTSARGKGDYSKQAMEFFRRGSCTPLSNWELGDSVFDNRREGFRIEAGAADQCAVDLALGHEGLRVLGFHGASVQDS